MSERRRMMMVSGTDFISYLKSKGCVIYIPFGNFTDSDKNLITGASVSYVSGTCKNGTQSGYEDWLYVTTRSASSDNVNYDTVTLPNVLNSTNFPNLDYSAMAQVKDLASGTHMILPLDSINKRDFLLLNKTTTWGDDILPTGNNYHWVSGENITLDITVNNCQATVYLNSDKHSYYSFSRTFSSSDMPRNLNSGLSIFKVINTYSASKTLAIKDVYVFNKALTEAEMNEIRSLGNAFRQKMKS